MSSWGKPVQSSSKPIGFIKPTAQPPVNSPSDEKAISRPQVTGLPLSINLKSSHSAAPGDQAAAGQERKEPELPKGIKRSAAGKTWEDPTLTDWNPSDFRIFVGNLGPEVTDQMLRSAFTPHAPSLTNCRVVRDKHSGKSKGYGFVAISESEDYVRAMKEMSGKYVGSKPVKLTRSSWKDRNVADDNHHHVNNKGRNKNKYKPY